jgi:hypothetical protein
MTGTLILVFWFLFFFVFITVPLTWLVERLSAESHALWSCLLLVALFFQRRLYWLLGSSV